MPRYQVAVTFEITDVDGNVVSVTVDVDELVKLSKELPDLVATALEDV